MVDDADELDGGIGARMSEPVTLDVDGRVATISLNAPPANALGVEVSAALAEVLDRLEAESGVRAVVIRSAVPKFFAAGADIKLMSEADTDGFTDYLERLRGSIERIPTLSAISIAAIEGHALGGGLELALACTLRVVTPRAKLGLPEVRLGLLPGAGGTQRLPRLIGPGKALDLILTGRAVGGEEAVAMGLAERLAADDEAVGEATKLAGRLAKLSGPALEAIVRSVDAAADVPLDEGLDLERREIVGLFEGPDAREGLVAFLEKRTPDFG